MAAPVLVQPDTRGTHPWSRLRRYADPMRTLARVAAAAFRQQSTYRTATLAGVFTNSVFGLIRASIMLAAIRTAGGELNGYDALHAATYVWLGQALLAPIEAFGTRELGQRIHAGDVAVDLLRPTGLLRLLYAQKLGRAGFNLLARGIPPFAVGAVVTGVALPDSPWSVVLGAIATVLAITVSFLADAMVNLAAFWLLETRGLSTVYTAVMNLLAGFLIPIAWVPPWLLALAHATPFPSMVQTPIDVLSGRITPQDAVSAVGIQLLWTAILTPAAWLMLRAGVRATEVQGG